MLPLLVKENISFFINGRLIIKIMKRYVIASIVLGVVLPLAAQADIIPLQPMVAPVVSAPMPPPSPLMCYDFTRALKMGSKGYDVRALQYAMIHEGWSIPTSEYGMFGISTQTAVTAFQTKYASQILPNAAVPTGTVGNKTRMELNALYGCAPMGSNSSMMMNPPMAVATSNTPMMPANVALKVQDIILDQNGVTGTFCNQSAVAVPIFPVRLRVNGINRDVSVTGAVAAGACDTETVPYSAWGLTYDPNSTYGAAAILDPNGMYKSMTVAYPLSTTTSITVPAVAGFQLAVRGITIKSNGLQGTFCNLGSQDTTSFPVKITLNGMSQTLDVATAYKHGTCQTMTWPYSTWNFTGATGATVSATVNVDPMNMFNETNELDNSASIVGSI
jgi:hypothetical protein